MPQKIVERTLYMRFRNSMKKAFKLQLWQEYLDEFMDGRYPSAQRMMKKNNWLAFTGTEAVKKLKFIAHIIKAHRCYLSSSFALSFGYTLLNLPVFG